MMLLLAALVLIPDPEPGLVGTWRARPDSGQNGCYTVTVSKSLSVEWVRDGHPPLRFDGVLHRHGGGWQERYANDSVTGWSPPYEWSLDFGGLVRVRHPDSKSRFDWVLTRVDP